MKALMPNERIERKILLLCGEKVMLSADLAELYGVPDYSVPNTSLLWTNFPPLKGSR